MRQSYAILIIIIIIIIIIKTFITRKFAEAANARSVVSTEEKRLQYGRWLWLKGQIRYIKIMMSTLPQKAEQRQESCILDAVRKHGCKIMFRNERGRWRCRWTCLVGPLWRFVCF